MGSIQALGVGEEQEHLVHLEAEKFMQRYHKATNHIQGCMIESLAQDLDFYGKNDFRRHIVVETLRRLAADMK